jgi:hypothetical protein
MTITVYGAPVELTADTIAATRAWYADNALAMLAEAREYVESNGARGQRVNDLASYATWCEGMAADSLRGDSDHTLAFVQRAYYIQTGKSVPILA